MRRPPKPAAPAKPLTRVEQARQRQQKPTRAQQAAVYLQKKADGKKERNRFTESWKQFNAAGFDAWGRYPWQREPGEPAGFPPMSSAKDPFDGGKG